MRAPCSATEEDTRETPMTALPDAPAHPLRRDHERQLAELAALIERLASARIIEAFPHVGAHMRHVIEHLEALLMPAQPGRIAYDARPRDLRLERDPRHALTRVQALRARLSTLDDDALQTPVEVTGLTGAQGEWPFSVASTFGRELAFAASHTVHHLALLRPSLERLGWVLDPCFGRAPATLAHDRACRTASATAAHTTPALNA